MTLCATASRDLCCSRCGTGSRCRNETPWAPSQASILFGDIFLLVALIWRSPTSRRGCTAPASQGSLPWTSVLQTPTRSSPVREPPPLAGDCVVSAKSLWLPGSRSLSLCFRGIEVGQGAQGILSPHGKASQDSGPQERWVDLDLVGRRLLSLTAPCFVFQAGLIKTSSSLTRARSRSWRHSKGIPRRLPVLSSIRLRCAQARVRLLPSQPGCPRSGFLGPFLVLCSGGLSASMWAGDGPVLACGERFRMER